MSKLNIAACAILVLTLAVLIPRTLSGGMSTTLVLAWALWMASVLLLVVSVVIRHIEGGR